MPKKLNRLLITGASGALGSHCRKHVKDLANTIRVTDKAEISDNPESNSKIPEEVVRCNLSDYEAVLKLVDGCDGILHFGGQATEADWKTVKTSNIEGIYNLYEAARIKGCKRIFFASSIHAIGFHPLTKKIDDKASIRPDTLYGASKAFGEAIARMYFEKFGIETACVRIASCQPAPQNHRMLATWFSYNDLVSLVKSVFEAPVLGCPIIYGVSNNDRKWANNNAVSFLGWSPSDNANDYKDQIDQAMDEPEPTSDDFNFIGGPFVSFEIMNETE
ncbi:MAG: NAD(P)-dependent oxidoreductase [Pseudomonadota bacterium]|nr:NAD(P)-dependent oxidoreductase [Pseudomonadota bacterium]